MGERIGDLIAELRLTHCPGQRAILPHIVNNANAVNARLSESTFTWVVLWATHVWGSDS